MSTSWRMPVCDRLQRAFEPRYELPVTGYLLLQHNHTALASPTKWNVFLPTSTPIVLMVFSGF
jgi:hypothetical protein